ncbi:helix-turn-helix transcriptional regulator [Mycobacterium asiaticum]|nr:AAA family ATPase [Mycobacterium asiaticum]
MARLVEREAEIAQLSALLDSARSGRGQVCVIEGPSGVGKTRLVDECYRSCAAHGLHGLRARGNELTRDYPFGVARTLVETRVIQASDTARAKLMQGPAALAEPLFGLGEAMDHFRVIHGLYWLTLNLADQQPLAMLVDDVHWADHLTLRFLAYVAERIEDIPLVMVVTIRTGDQFADSQLVSHLWDAATGPSIRPAELSENGVAMLLTDALPDRQIDASLVRAVVSESGGNPLYVLAMADALSKGADPKIATPESVRRHIVLRMARLDRAARDLARAASVLCDGAAPRDVVRLAGLSTDEGIVAAEELVAAGLFASADPITFAHGITRAAIYNSLEPAERLQLHAHAAKLLAAGARDPEAVAEHLLKSNMPDEAWTLAALHDAGRAAARKGAHDSAIRYLQRAVDLLAVEKLPARLLIDLGLAEAAAGKPTSLARFEHALGLVNNHQERADALYSLGQTLFRFGRYAEASKAFRRGAELFRDGQQQIRRRFEGAASGAEYHLSATQRGPSSTVDEHPERDGPGDRAVLAFQALRDAMTTPPADRAGDLAVRALGNGALLAEQTSEGPSVNLAVLALLHAGRLVEAHEAADATVRDARERGGVLAHAEASLVRALVLYERGNIPDAAADAQVAWEAISARSHVHANGAMATLANCMIERGELDEAAGLFDGVWKERRPSDAPIIEAYVHTARGLLHLRRGDIAAGRADLTVAEQAMRTYGALNLGPFRWRSLAGVAAYLAGDEQSGRELIEEEIRLAQLFGVPISLGIALRRRAFTEKDDAALPTLQQALAILSETEAKLELARTHWRIGCSLRRTGLRVQARTHLGVGLDLAHRCGAMGLEADIRDELAAAGGRPRRPAVTGIESLTPTELRVARFAAMGLSNNKIAEQIFVSRNTISWHLRNVYRKLQIESRDQLPLAVRAN